MDFTDISPCDLADALPRSQFLHHSIRPLWQGIPRIAGPAFTARCAPGDHLMLHAAIYAAAPGDIIVVEADDEYALAGGNVCAIAQQRGIAGFVVDGCIRDIAEVRDMQFPVFGRGVIPKPGAKKAFDPLNQPVVCGGVHVHPGDIIVADEEGIAVVPKEQASQAHNIAQQRAQKDASLTLAQWQAQHRQTVNEKLKAIGQVPLE
ncbi:RraA family protein [Aestuariibacter salexigens]|uniref:RraA family protein n=1 Tax=Aestuariibacter salexigens TaxID=226010 RepID=UPI00047D3878|nr:RraA family protein [Aestuariibacter salexigens]